MGIAMKEIEKQEPIKIIESVYDVNDTIPRHDYTMQMA